MSRRLFTIVVVWLIVALRAMDRSVAGAASTITGVVRDSSGATVPGATVRVVNEDTGAAVEAVSNEQGSYRAAPLAPGRYRMETTLDGFETAVRRVVLEPGQTAAIDVTLDAGALH